MYRNRSASASATGLAVWGVALGLLAIIGVGSAISRNVVTTKTVVETAGIAYETVYIEDDELAYGEKETRVSGVPGLRENIYEVKIKGDEEISRELKDTKVVREPKDEVIAKGTKPVWRCHDTTSYDQNPYNDNYCEYSDGTGKYVPDSQAKLLDPEYTPGKSGAPYYNSF